MDQLTEQLVEYAQALSYEDLPQSSEHKDEYEKRYDEHRLRDPVEDRAHDPTSITRDATDDQAYDQ